MRESEWKIIERVGKASGGSWTRGVYWKAGLALVLTFTLFATQAPAAVVQVQTATGVTNGGLSVSATYPATPTAGNLLVALAGNYNGSGSPTVPPGWSTARYGPSHTPGQSIYYKISGASEPTVVTISDYPLGFDTRLGLHIYEYSGIDAGDPLDVTNMVDGYGTSISPGGVTTTASTSLIIAAFITNVSTSALSWTDSFLEQNNFANGGQPASQATYAGAHLITGSAGTYTTTATTEADGNWRAQIVAFNAVPPQATEYVVTNTNDSGAGSLRAAIDYANLNAGTTISFDIPDTDLGYQTDGTDHWWRISPAVGLPAITESGTTIDGSTQTTNRGDTNTRGPEIEIYGASAGTADGLTMSAAGAVVIRDLIINSFTGQGIQFNGVATVGGGVYGCYLGTDAVGEADLGNTNYGIWVTNGASDLDIGGSGAGEGNLISGNIQGVVVDSGSLIRILGNKIGTDRTGTVAISQSQGILISGTASSVTIGGSAAGAGNLVSGNASQISVEGSASSVVMFGNIIGSDPSGTMDLSNGRGIELDSAADPSGIDIGGFLPGEGNLIAFNTTGIMVWWGGGGHRIRGNTIRNGSGGGMAIYAPDVEVAGNVIHDNGGKGIYITTGATGTMVLNNTIHGHTASGVEIATDGEAALHNNVITGSTTYGLFMSGGTLSSESHNLVTDNLTNPPNTTRCNVALDASDLNADPLYVDAAGGDFSLTECTSPAINAGLDFGGAQPDLNGTEPGNYNGIAPDIGGLESGCSSIGVAISGQVFEDADFTGTASEYDGGAGDRALAIVDVELYDATDGYLASTITDATGNYSFAGLTDGTYKIRVRSATLGDADTPPAGGLNASVGVTWPYPLPEMTWANGAALYGGQVATADDTDTGDDLGPGDTWVAVSVSGVNVSGVNLGFTYNLIVNTADDGLVDVTRSDQGSLRQFLKNANAIGTAAATTANSSEFHLQVAANQSDGADSWWRITPVAVMPSLADPGIDLDGATQTINGGDSNSRGPEVEINGAMVPDLYGLTLTSADHVINSLVINGFETFPGTGIVLDGASVTGVVITGCHVGTDAVGTLDVENRNGITLANGVAGTVIGGGGAGEGNVISGNYYGIWFDNAGASTTIRGNRIGTNATGDAAIGNINGLYVDGGTAIVIGGSGVGEGNLISGNISNGMNLQYGDDFTIQGNWMGLNLAGTDPLPDGGTAIYGWSVDNVTIGGSAPGEGNIIAGNDGFGISLAAGCQRWVIQGNTIGAGPLGTETNLGNTGAGNIRVVPNDITIDATIGGENPGEGNLIAYSGGPGISCVSLGAAVEIIGNVIRDNAEEGINARVDSLTVALNEIYDNGVGFDGIIIQDVASDGKIYQNTIHGSGDDGIEVVGIGHEIRNNIITGSGGYGINLNGGTMTESNNDVTGNATSPANVLGRSNVALDASDLNADPLYVDDAGGDFSLTECTSPAINVGLDLGVNQPDLNGTDPGNYNGVAPDMGALESSCASIIRESAAVAVAPDGEHVVVWASDGQDGDSWGVYAQLYDSNDNPVGGEIPVNANSTGAQQNPSVAIDDSGNFVITWQTTHVDPSYFNVFAQRFDNGGNKLDGEFRVDGFAGANMQNPSVAMDAVGNFTIAFEAEGGFDGNGAGIYLRRYDNLGGSLSTAVVNSYSTGDQTDPVIAMDAAGNFVVVWSSDLQDGDARGIYGQRFNPVGGTVGGEFPVNGTTANDQYDPAVAMNGNGQFVVAWTGYDVLSLGIFTQSFAADGTMIGCELQVNTTTDSTQDEPAVAIAADGRFTVAWQDVFQEGDHGIYAQSYDANLTKLGTELRINAITVGDQKRPAIGIDAGNQIVVAWDGVGAGGSGQIDLDRLTGSTDPFIIAENTTSASVTAQNSIIWSHTVGDGANRYLTVALAFAGSGPGSATVTYGGVPLSIITALSNLNAVHIELWGLTAPPSGTADILVALPGAEDFAASATSYFGVDQSVPYGGEAANTGTGAPASYTTTVSPGELRVAAVAVDTGPVLTPLSCQAERWNTGPASVTGAGGTMPGSGGAVTMSWDTGGNNRWAMASATLNPALGSGSNISGTVFEDADFAGTATDYDGGTGDLALANVDVELYDGSDGYVASTTTALDGSFSFATLADDNYKVRVRSATIGDADTPPAGGLQPTVPATWPYPLPELSWANGGSLLGGQDATVDDTATGDDAGPGDNWTVITVSGASVTGVDFGFVYNLIVNTSDDGRADNARSDQGSLRQFLKNANAIGTAGGTTANTSQFRMQVAANQINGPDSWWRLTPSAALPILSDDGTVVDGSTQENNSGVDSNTLGPEIEVDGSGAGSAHGFDVASNNNEIRGLIVNGFSGSGFAAVQINGVAVSGNTVLGNYLGTNYSGTASIPNHYGVWILGGASTNTVGGETPNERNIISGNNSSGIQIQGLGTNSNVVTGNYVGTDRDGGAAIPNSMGVMLVVGPQLNLIGGSTVAKGNLISGNSGYGIQVQGANGNTIRGNRIGTDITGIAPLGNGVGVIITAGAQSNIVGGTGTGEGNVIAFNSDDGVYVTVDNSDGNIISANSIFQNTALGIDIGSDGVGPGTSDANNAKAAPSISSITPIGSDFDVVVSAVDGDGIEFFRVGNTAAPTVNPDPSGYGEGYLYLGRCADNGGFAEGPHIDAVVDSDPAVGVIRATLLASGISSNDEISATASDVVNGTSEFSTNVVAPSPSSYSISGIVFEDTDFAGTATDYDGGTNDLGLANVDVELYDGTDGYVASVMTAVGGSYSFTGLSDDSYKVRARSATLGDADTPPAGGLHPTVPATWPYPLPDMTWAHGAAFIGGQDTAVDDTATGDNAGPGDTWIAVTVSGGDVAGVNLGFSYDLIVNEDDDANADSVRSKQGCLRQFIKNSNAIVGVNKSWFLIALP